MIFVLEVIHLRQVRSYSKTGFMPLNLGGYPDEPTTTMEGYPTTAPPTTATTTAVVTTNDGNVIKLHCIAVFCIYIEINTFAVS